MMLILIVSGVLGSVILSSNIYAQNELNFQYENFPNNLAETVEKASENPNSSEMKLLECVTYSNSVSLGESLEMYKQRWSKIQPIIESEEFSMDTKITIIAVEWNAIDSLNSPIPFIMDLCAKSYDETGKFLHEID
jgi:hypothetical protein